jgi:DnaJ homolog subfamily B member 6
LYGVWPPPEEFPEQPNQRRRERSGYSSHYPTHPSVPRFDPFFTDPFAHHRPSPGFAFTNPFELFESIFSDMTREVHRTSAPVVTPYFFDPYIHRQGSLHRSNSMSPFPGFSPFIVTPHLFSSLFSHDDNDHWGSGPSMPTNSYSYSSTTSAQHGPDGNGQQPRWISESTVTRTINGVTQTIHTRKDSLVSFDVVHS